MSASRTLLTQRRMGCCSQKESGREHFIIKCAGGHVHEWALGAAEECGTARSKGTLEPTNSTAGGVALDLQWQGAHVDRRSGYAGSAEEHDAQHEAGLWIDYREKVNQSRVFYDSDSILLYNRSRTSKG